MANSEPDYEPRVDNLKAFDLKMDMDTAEDPSRLPLLVVIALVVLAAFAGVVWLAYTQGVERGRASISRELTAGEVWKIRKSNVPPYMGLKIYEQASTEGQPSTVSPASHRTQANAIPALRPSAGVGSDASIPPQANAANRARAGNPPTPQNIAKPTPEAAATGPKQAAATGVPAALNKTAVPVMPTHPLTLPDAPPATQTSAPHPAASPASGAHSAAPAAGPPSTAPKTAVTNLPGAALKAPASSLPDAALKGVVLQIGSYKSEAEARQSWKAFKQEHSAAAGYEADVKAADLGAKGTWYRLRMGAFPNKQAAVAVCSKLKADGASCLVAQ